MVDKAGLYGGGLEITCILNEGTMTATAGTSVFVENGAIGKLSFGFSAEVREGDFVGLNVDAYNDYDRCGGLPVVMQPTAAVGWIGIVKSQPVWHKVPTSAGAISTWSDDSAGLLDKGWYRVATVVIPSVTMAFKGEIQGTAVTVGSPVDYDLSEEAFAAGSVGSGETFGTGMFSFHDGGVDAQNALIGIGLLNDAGGTDADCYGHLVV